jgi:predicted DNA-binding transcriptional regulator AlpA
MRKSDRKRPYPPDFVSVETLAYRLDCSERMAQDYAKAGILPEPRKIGNLVRWLWQDVQDRIASMNGALVQGCGGGEDDATTIAIEAARQAREKARDRTA